MEDVKNERFCYPPSSITDINVQKITEMFTMTNDCLEDSRKNVGEERNSEIAVEKRCNHEDSC
jgi:hypothetical protein